MLFVVPTLLQPKDVINTPVTLEFLGLNERALVTENDLEQSILDNLQRFLLEMGHGFCFEARQKRILIDEEAMNAFISSSLGSSIMYFCTKIFGFNPAVAYFTNVSELFQSRSDAAG